MSAPFRDQRSVKQYQKRRKNKNSVKTCCFLVPFLHLFSLSIIITHSAAVFRHCLPPPRSSISTFHSLSHIFFVSSAKTLLLSLPSSLCRSLFSFSVAPHPWSILAKLQSLIRPVEAPIWPLISISDLSVRDRVYTGSSLECKAPSPSAVPQTWSHLLPSLPSFAVLATLSLLISLSPQR